MKKVLTALVSVALVASVFTGCSKKNETAAAKKSAGDKTWIVATDTVFRPFEFTNEKNEFVGIDVDILAAVAEDQ